VSAKATTKPPALKEKKKETEEEEMEHIGQKSKERKMIGDFG